MSVAATPEAVDFGQLAPPPPPPSTGEQAAAELEAACAAAYADGLVAGRQEAQAMLAPALTVLDAAAASLREAQAEAAQEAEVAAVELALRIAEQALYAQLAVAPELVVDVVRGALRRLVERDRVLLLVNPGDLDVVRAATAGLISELGGIGHLEVQAERRIAPGGAMVRTPEGDVDASLETKLERAREVLEEALADGR